MEKLVNLFEKIGSVNPSSYPNISFEGRTTSDKINLSLLSEINSAAKSANITVSVSTAVSGHKTETSSGNVSRHTSGEAVDISKIDGKGWFSKEDARQKGILDKIEEFVSNLKRKGYSVNSESGNDKSVLYFGFDGHNNHIHVSMKLGSSSSISLDGDDNEKSTPEDFAKNYLTNIIGKVASPLLGINESKQNRIIKDIEKIKKLL